MKRLTKKNDYNGAGGYIVTNETASYMWQARNFTINGGEHVDRLAAIENILGDDYDLERLAELVRADREGRKPEPAAEVVRCRDCRRCDGFHGDQVEPGEIGICKINQMAVGPDSFCSWGIRRE